MTLVLGVDGGQSSTRTLLADGEGTLLGACRTGPANHIHEPGGLDRQYKALHDGMLGAFGEARIMPCRLDVACVGVTGSGHRPTAEAALDAHRLLLLGDMNTAFAGAIPDLIGTVVIAGTGSIAYGRDATGRDHRTGGWGYLAGDEGSGYDLGVRALREVFRAFDGRGPETELTPRMLEHYEVGSLAELRDRIYRPSTTRAYVAASADHVSLAASDGDVVARRLLREAGAKLAELANGVLDHLDESAGRAVALVGGLTSSGNALTNSFRNAVHARHPAATIAAPRLDAARGAVVLALRELGGGAPTESLITRLARAVPYRDARSGPSAARSKDTGPLPRGGHDSEERSA